MLIAIAAAEPIHLMDLVRDPAVVCLPWSLINQAPETTNYDLSASKAAVPDGRFNPAAQMKPAPDALYHHLAVKFVDRDARITLNSAQAAELKKIKEEKRSC